MENAPVAVSINNLVKRFGEQTILKGISFNAMVGETVCIIGPSGGGKSTVLKCINGLNKFDSGSITIAGTQLTSTTGSNTLQDIRRQVGMIFQDFRLFSHMTALENVMEAPVQLLKQNKGSARDQAVKLLQQVGLGDRAYHRPHQLSGGQQQRVAIARALAMKPKALLCDEVTSALDPERKQDVLSVLKDLRKEGMTIIMVTHEMGFARKAADKVIVLAEGQVVEEGTPSQVFDHPQHDRTRQFLSKVME